MKYTNKVPFMENAAFQVFMNECIRRHKLSPEISPLDYLATKQAELEREIGGKKLVYLDTNHLVNLRHVTLKRAKALPAYQLMLETLSKLCRQGKILCPVAGTLLEELMSQTDPATRSASARVMDALSGGLCLRNWLEIAVIEWRQHVYRVLHAMPGPHFFAFTKAGYSISEHVATLSHPGIPRCDSQTLEKLYIDIRWRMTFDDYQGWPGWDPIPESMVQEILDVAATEKINLRETGASFEKVRTASLRGWIKSLQDDLFGQLPKLCRGVPGAQGDHMKRIMESLEQDPGKMPSFDVLSGLDAAMILSNRNLNANDTRDLMHAAVAVPYCDVFCCDKHIASLLCTKPLQFDKTYKTRVLSRPEDINSYLGNLIEE